MDSEAAAVAERMQPSQTVIVVQRTEMSEAVKAELRCHPQMSRACPDALVQVLRSTYGERRSINCPIWQLFRISQHPNESLRAYTHCLLQAFEALTDRQRALSETPFSESILRDQFDEDVAPQANLTYSEIKIEGQLAALFKQVEELAAQIVRLQLSGPENSSCPHCNHHQPGQVRDIPVRQITSQQCVKTNRSSRKKRPATKNRKCYTCGKPGHLARNGWLKNRFQGQQGKCGNRDNRHHHRRNHRQYNCNLPPSQLQEEPIQGLNKRSSKRMK
uniref:CCHC-type domain-containing protein n=1 Tax=Biomphalaria glabrata TaxID=6526 RepID=A0A2C9M8P2_BIOGL